MTSNQTELTTNLDAHGSVLRYRISQSIPRILGITCIEAVQWLRSVIGFPFFKYILLVRED